jgi:transposase InsO family protein
MKSIDQVMSGASGTASASGLFRFNRLPGLIRRVWRDVLEEGLACGLHRIERLMRLKAMRARPKRRGNPKDDGERSVIADTILDRDFAADRPNRKWLAGFTCIWTAEGWLYVAVVLDLFSRRVVGPLWVIAVQSPAGQRDP